jgi:hypothetical protein
LHRTLVRDQRAPSSGDNIPLGGFALKTGFEADAAAELKWPTILVENLASLYGVHSAPLDHRKIGVWSGADIMAVAGSIKNSLNLKVQTVNNPTPKNQEILASRCRAAFAGTNADQPFPLLIRFEVLSEE